MHFAQLVHTVHPESKSVCIGPHLSALGVLSRAYVLVDG